MLIDQMKEDELEYLWRDY